MKHSIYFKAERTFSQFTHFRNFHKEILYIIFLTLLHEEFYQYGQ